MLRGGPGLPDVPGLPGLPDVPDYPDYPESLERPALLELPELLEPPVFLVGGYLLISFFPPDEIYSPGLCGMPLTRLPATSYHVSTVDDGGSDGEEMPV